VAAISGGEERRAKCKIAETDKQRKLSGGSVRHTGASVTELNRVESRAGETTINVEWCKCAEANPSACQLMTAGRGGGGGGVRMKKANKKDHSGVAERRASRGQSKGRRNREQQSIS